MPATISEANDPCTRLVIELSSRDGKPRSSALHTSTRCKSEHGSKVTARVSIRTLSATLL